MKKVKEKAKNVKKVDYVSLNGDYLKNIKGGTNVNTKSGNTDHLCGQCGPTAGLLSANKLR